MSPRKHRLKAVSCSIAAIAALMALTPSLAHGLDWTIKGSSFEDLALEKEEVTGSTSGAIAFDVPELGLEIECKGASITGTLVKGGSGSATIKFTECVVVGAEAVCTVSIATAKLVNEQGEASGGVYFRLKPASGETFGTVTISGEECAVATEEELITGSAVGEIGEEELVKLPFTFSQEISEEVGAELAYGATPMSMSGALQFWLSGINITEIWGWQIFSTNPTGGLSFGNVMVGQSKELDIKLIYSGRGTTAALGPITVQTNGMTPAFAEANDGCNTKVLTTTNRNCTVKVKFSPLAPAGEKTGTVKWQESAAPNRSYSRPLKGVGT